MKKSLIAIILILIVLLGGIFYFIRLFIPFGPNNHWPGAVFESIQDEIDNVWKMNNSEEGSTSMKLELEEGLTAICFTNNSDYNVFVKTDPKTYKKHYSLNMTLSHLNISKITQYQNPYCIENGEEIRFIKESGEKLIIIK